MTTEARPAALRLIRADGTPAPVAEKNGVSAAFDGVLHERAELARELGAAADASGADLVLAAYERWGADAAHRLSGTYAWAVRDAAAETLLAVRDAVGAWPLFYASAGSHIVLSSSIPALLDEPGVSNGVNLAAIADHLCNRWPDPGETYYEAVRRVPPGHVLRSDGATTTVRRYWNPAPPDGEIRWVERDELDRFDHLMEQAVTRPLELGPSAIFLSGGLDSVSVAAMATDVGPKPLALSVEFPDDANETAVQRGVARQLGLEHVLLDFEQALGGKSLVQAALDTSASWPQPLANLWYPLYRPLAEEGVDRGVRVILTGGGGDEWLSVSPFLAADLMRRGDVRGLYRLWSTMHRSYKLSRLATLRSVLWTFGSRPVLAAAGHRYVPGATRAYRRRRRAKLSPDWVAPDPELRRRLDERAESAFEHGYEQGFYLREGQLSLDHALVSLEMEELHESGRRSGVAMRMPFWDPDLVDFLYRTPPELLTEGERSKSLVRRMLDRRFPQLGFERHRKVLATNLFARLLVSQGAEAWRTTEGPFALNACGVIDKTGLNSLVEGIFRGERLEEVSRFWNLISLESWLRPRVTARGG